MDVKDVNAPKAIQPPSQNNTDQISRRSARELTADKVTIANTESVTVEVKAKTSKPSEPREKANEVINAINLVSVASEEIDKFVTSLAGIAEQASQDDMSDSRRAILDREAKELVAAIEQKSEIETSPGIKPLKGDAIKFEIEEELGKTLEVILPDTTPENLGLATISLSPADQIIQTRAVIDSARAQLEELKNALESSKQEVADSLTRADVASANREAAEASIREVDEALKLTGNIQNTISESPESALTANALESDALRLLR